MTVSVVPAELPDEGVVSTRPTTMALQRLLFNGDGFCAEKATDLKLGTSDIVVLGHLCLKGPMSPRDLSSLMGVTSGTMTALLDRVEKAGFLLRTNNPDDRRSLIISATPEGRHAMEWAFGEFDDAIKAAAADLPDVTPEQLARAFRSVSAALESRRTLTPR